MDCLFCKICAGTIPANLLYEDERVIAFKDIKPQAPVHLLIVPKQHIATLNELKEVELAGHIVLTAGRLATEQGLAETGYRTVMNCNSDGGQLVYHVHCHLLGGRQMMWPPG